MTAENPENDNSAAPEFRNGNLDLHTALAYNPAMKNAISH